MFLKPFIFRIKLKLRNTIPAVQTLVKPYGVFFKADLGSKVGCQRSRSKVNIQVRETLAKECVSVTEETITVYDSLRILIFILHILPHQLIRHIVVFALADLPQISAVYRSSVRILFNLRSSCDHAHQRTACVLVSPVITEFLFCFFPVQLIAFSRTGKTYFADIYFCFVKIHLNCSFFYRRSFLF